MRYFTNFYNNAPFALWRFEVPVEEQWNKTEWVPSDNVVSDYLVLGERDIEEISYQTATKYFPDAFYSVTKNVGKYEVTKAEGEKRYTLGAMYIPDIIDAHGEWTDSDELQKAVWDYVRSNDRRIRLQHDREIVAGEWVEVMAFPYPLTVPIQSISGVETNHTYPANTVFLGVIWEPWAWDMVKSGKILGYSIGGKAERLYVDMEEPVEKEDGPGVNDVHIDTLMNPKKKKPKV